MKTIEYKLQSEPKISVTIPEVYMNLTQKLLDDVTNANSGLDLINAAREHRYLFNDQISSLVSQILYSNQNPRKQAELKDRLLLDVTMYCLSNDYEASMKEIKKEYEEKENNIAEAYKALAGPILKVMERFELKKTINDN